MLLTYFQPLLLCAEGLLWRNGAAESIKMRLTGPTPEVLGKCGVQRALPLDLGKKLPARIETRSPRQFLKEQV